MTRAQLTEISSALYKSKQDRDLWNEIWKVLKSGSSHRKDEIEVPKELLTRIKQLEL
jgi:hypothetical protein